MASSSATRASHARPWPAAAARTPMFPDTDSHGNSLRLLEHHPREGPGPVTRRPVGQHRPGGGRGEPRHQAQQGALAAAARARRPSGTPRPGWPDRSARAPGGRGRPASPPGARSPPRPPSEPVRTGQRRPACQGGHRSAGPSGRPSARATASSCFWPTQELRRAAEVLRELARGVGGPQVVGERCSVASRRTSWPIWRAASAGSRLSWRPIAAARAGRVAAGQLRRRGPAA